MPGTDAAGVMTPAVPAAFAGRPEPPVIFTGPVPSPESFREPSLSLEALLAECRPHFAPVRAQRPPGDGDLEFEEPQAGDWELVSACALKALLDRWCEAARHSVRSTYVTRLPPEDAPPVDGTGMAFSPEGLREAEGEGFRVRLPLLSAPRQELRWPVARRQDG